MQFYHILLFALMFFSCNSQNNENNNLEKNKVLSAFLSNQKEGTYVDKYFFEKNLIYLFTGKLKHHKKIFKTSDSICRNSKDTIQLKISCPIAEGFRKYNNVLSLKELDFLLNKYDNKKKETIVLLKLDTLVSNTKLLFHSKEYYNQIKYDEYEGIPDIGEYPSVQIENIYFNQSKNVAIVAYSIITSSKVIETNFFLLEKTIDLKWEPIGSLKL